MNAIKPIETRYKGYRFRSRLEARYAIFLDTLGVKWEYEKEGYNLDGVLYLPDFYLPDYEWWVEVKGQKLSDEEQEKAERLAAATRQKVLIFEGVPGAEDWHITLITDNMPSDTILFYANLAAERGDTFMVRALIHQWPGFYWEDVLAKFPAGTADNIERRKLACDIRRTLLGLCPNCASLGLGWPAQKQVYERTLEQGMMPNGHFVVILEQIEQEDPDLYDYCDNCDAEVQVHPDHPLLLEAFRAATSARFEHGETPQVQGLTI